MGQRDPFLWPLILTGYLTLGKSLYLSKFLFLFLERTLFLELNSFSDTEK